MWTLSPIDLPLPNREAKKQIVSRSVFNTKDHCALADWETGKARPKTKLGHDIDIVIACQNTVPEVGFDAHDKWIDALCDEKVSFRDALAVRKDHFRKVQLRNYLATNPVP